MQLDGLRSSLDSEHPRSAFHRWNYHRDLRLSSPAIRFDWVPHVRSVDGHQRQSADQIVQR